MVMSVDSFVFPFLNSSKAQCVAYDIRRSFHTELPRGAPGFHWLEQLLLRIRGVILAGTDSVEGKLGKREPLSLIHAERLHAMTNILVRFEALQLQTVFTG